MGELVRGDDDRPWYGQVDIRIFFQNPAGAEFHVDEGQASSFPSKRTTPYAAEKQGFVVIVSAELGNDALSAFRAVTADDFYQLLLDFPRVAFLRYLEAFDL